MKNYEKVKPFPTLPTTTAKFFQSTKTGEAKLAWYEFLVSFSMKR